MATVNNCTTFLYRYKRASYHIRMIAEIIRSLNLSTVNCVLTFDRDDDCTNSRSYKSRRIKGLIDEILRYNQHFHIYVARIFITLFILFNVKYTIVLTCLFIEILQFRDMCSINITNNSVINNLFLN